MNPSASARVLAAALALLCLGIACTPAAPGTPGPSGSPAATPIAADLTPWQQEMANLDADGARSLESALRLFVMAFGPLPGVDGTSAEAGTVDSASPAVAAIYAHWDELTTDQQGAVEGYLAVPDDAKTLDVPVVPATSPSPGAQPSAARTNKSIAMVGGGAILADARPYTNLEQELLEEAARVRAWAATYFGDIPELAVQLPNDPNEPYLTFFNPNPGPNGVDRCQVVVNFANANDNRFQTRRALTLDIVHCLQSHVMGNESGWEGQVPPWAWDGPAQFIAFEMWPQEVADAMAWVTYLQGTDISLFARGYDAAGYYAQAFEAGVSLGAAFKAVLTDVDNAERFALAGTATGAFLDKWASELSRREFGPAWDFSGPQILSPASARAPITNIGVSIGSTEAFSQPAYTNHLFAMSSSADIVIVEAFGRVRISDGDVDQVIMGNASFCTTDKGCGPCPDGSDPTIEQVKLVGDSLIAVSGGTDGTNGTVSGHALEEFCLPTPSPSSSPDDEFCRRWDALLAWMQQYAGSDFELTQPWAAEIHRQSSELLLPVAPPEMVQYVNVYITVYGKYAFNPEPINVPIVGPDAANLGTAFFAIYNYCLNQPATPPPATPPPPTPPPATPPPPPSSASPAP